MTSCGPEDDQDRDRERRDGRGTAVIGVITLRRADREQPPAEDQELDDEQRGQHRRVEHARRDRRRVRRQGHERP